MSEQAKIDITIEGGGAAKTLGELRQQAEQVNLALEGAALGSQEYKKLNSQLIQVNTQVKNLELNFEALDREQVAGELGSVAGAIGDITSATILLGGENETLAEMAKNIEMALGVSMAFKGAIEGVSSAQKLLNNQMQKGSVIGRIATAVQAGFNAVMAMNPIGLVVAAVALLIAGFVLLAVKVKAIGDWFISLGAYVHDLIEGFGQWKYVILALLGPIGWLIAAWDFFFGEQAKKLDEQNKAEKAAYEERVRQGKELAKQNKQRIKEINDLRDARKEAFNDEQEIFDLEIARMEAEGKNANALKQAKIEAILEEEKAELETINNLIASWTKYYEDQFALSGKSREQFIAQLKGQGIDVEALQVQALDAIEKQNRKIYSAETELIKFQTSLRKEKIEEEIKDEVEKNEKLIDLRGEFLARLEAAENEYLDSKLSKEDQEINKVRDKYFILLEEARMFGEETLILEEAQAVALQEIEDRYAAERKEKEEADQQEIRDARQKTIDDSIAGAEQLVNIAGSLNTIFHGRELARIKQKQEAGIKLTQSEERRLKREEQIQKAFAIAQIAIDTAKGVSAAIAAGAGVPFPGNLIAIATGVAQVLSGIASATALLGGGGSAVSAPSIDTTAGGTSSQDNSAPVLNQFDSGSTYLNQPNKVFVVESDITSTQKNVASIEQSFTYG
jgi:hypothetical protein